VRIVDVFSHRNGKDILESPRFRPAYDEFVAVLKGLPPFRAAKGKRLARYVIAPTAMNNWLDNELCVQRQWDWHPLIIASDPGEPGGSQLRSDYRKARIEVEVQFGNVARYAYDVYKMAISLAMGQADVGIQVVCTSDSRGLRAIT
jgi:hypothetical protein